jgi:hypothetical protein
MEESLELENKILKLLLKQGYFNIECNSRDCDGVEGHSIIKYTSLEEYYKELESVAEWAEGPVSHKLTEDEPKGHTSHGQGWDIN